METGCTHDIRSIFTPRIVGPRIFESEFRRYRILGKEKNSIDALPRRDSDQDSTNNDDYNSSNNDKQEPNNDNNNDNSNDNNNNNNNEARLRPPSARSRASSA